MGKFLDAVVDNFLDTNDISVTKFLAEDTVVSNIHEKKHKKDKHGNPINPGPRNWRSYRTDSLEDYENDFSRDTDARWMNELYEHYANDPYHEHYYYDDYHGFESNKGKKGGKKGKKKDKKPKSKEDKDKEKEDKDREESERKRKEQEDKDAEDKAKKEEDARRKAADERRKRDEERRKADAERKREEKRLGIKPTDLPDP